MRFSKTTEYAIRILTYMGEKGSSSPHSASAVHKDLELPYKYITRLMTALAKKGLIKPIRGRDGGFVLAKEMTHISLLEIVSVFDTISGKGSCVLGYQKCSDDLPCCMHRYWEGPQNAITKMLNETMLRDLVSSQTDLNR